MRPGLLDVARHHHGVRAVGDELDDDLRVLRLALPSCWTIRCSICVRSRPGDLDGADVGNVDRAVVGHALGAEIGARPLDGREDAALVGLEDADLQHVAGRDGDAHRRPTDCWWSTDDRGSPAAVGDDGGRREIDDVERQRFGAVAWAPPIHGPSPGTTWQPATPRRQAENNGTSVARQRRSQLQIVKSRSPSGTVGTHAPSPLPIP